MAWIDVIQCLILVTDCSLAINEKKMNYVMGMLKKHDDFLNMDPSDAKEGKIPSIIAMNDNDKIMGYINSGLTLIEQRNCVSASKSSEFPYRIT